MSTTESHSPRQVKLTDTLENDELDLIYNQSNSSSKTTKWQRLLNWIITNPVQPTKDNVYVGARNFMYWNSNNVLFLFGGRMLINKRKPISIFVFTIMLLIFIFFCIFDLKFSWVHLNPAPVIIFIYCWFICLSSFIRASTSDPGIVPKNRHKVYTGSFQDIPDEYYNIYTLSTDRGRKLIVRYCPTCYNWRMPRTFHCSKCDTCISLHDHHCVWLNNCIGERNFRYFYNFVLFGVIACSFTCAFGYFHIFKDKTLRGLSTRDSLRHNPMSLANVILSHLSMTYPLALLGYHTYFLLTGQTTREYLRSVDKDHKNPFDSGSYWKNFVLRLMKPRGHCLVNKRGLYEPGDSRFERFNVEVEQE